jgi:hypothetical protein
MSDIGKLTDGAGFSAPFEMGSGQDTFDVYVGPEGGPRRPYAFGTKSGAAFTPLCERANGEHLWIATPGAEPTAANLTFYK